MKKITVLVSGGGTNLGALIKAEKEGFLHSGKITGVVSSSPDAYALKRAADASVPTLTVNRKEYGDRESFSTAVLEAVKTFEPDCVVLAGFMYVLDERFIEYFKNKIINVHPALIPSFCGDGFYGLIPHRAALERGVKLTGATVHFVNGETDGGPIILQKAVAVRENDTPETLQKRVMVRAEQIILPQAVELFCADKLTIKENGTVEIKKSPINIAIDGPSGTGKSTLAKNLAAKYGYIYVDTGALYRSIGLYVRNKKVDPKDQESVAALLPEISIEIKYDGGEQHVYLNGEDVGDKIRTPEISMYASAVSAHPPVRAFLLDMQRSIAAENDCVLDGRDIGTVILPNADVKIFLSSTAEERAERRYAELKEKGIATSYEEVLHDIKERDRNDSQRAAAPLVAADDAIHINNSAYEIEETLAKACEIIEKKLDEK